MFTGPNIVTDGLVFGYDTGYPQTTGSLLPQYRFNKGEPTENIRASTGLDSSYASSGRVIDNSGTLTVPNGTTGWSSITSVGDQNAGYRIAKFTYNNVTQDVEYTFSLELYNPGPNALEIFVDGNAGYGGTTIPLGHSIYSFTLTPPANRIQAIFFGTENKTNNVSYSPSRVILFKNYQVEAKSHATPFIEGTRSVSGSLIDLTRTTDIDVTNVSFDSNAQITFDGTDDYIDKTRKQYTIEESWSVEVIFKPTDNTDTSWNGLFGGHLTYGGYWMFHSAGNLTYYEGHSEESGTMITYRSWTKANTFTTDDYHHLTITYTPTNATSGSYDLYYNGGEKTDSFSWSFTWDNSLDSNYIGKGDSSRYGTNDIYIYKEYNRALSAAEVKQNYNAIKDRFNI